MNFQKCYEKYIRLYPDKKYYHSGEWHINHMLIDLTTFWNDFVNEFGFNKKEEKKLFEIAKLVILFHDIVYKVGAKDNEEKSSEFARKELPKYKYIEDVCELILSTKIDNKKFDTPIKKIIHDLDWNGFMFYDNLCINEEKIKNEALRDGFTEEEFIKGQLKFYKKISKIKLYHTNLFYVFNTKAKRNILKRIDELKNNKFV